MATAPVFVGVDVSKAQLDVALRPDSRFTAPNDEAGIAMVVDRLRAVTPTLIVLEATGGLQLPLTGALAAAALPVIVVNPRQVRDSAKAAGKLAKTDRLDAETLAHFAEVMRPEPRHGTIVHSDQGSQYASFAYQRLLNGSGLLPSMSRTGHCYDNAVVESFFHTLKTELVVFEDYHTRDQARRSVFEYIEVFYNRMRRHSTLNYRSPAQFETVNLSPFRVSELSG